MSDRLSRRPRLRPPAGPAIVVPVRWLTLLLAALAAGGTLATPGGRVVLLAASAALASLVTMDWPRWLHNVADILQIATAGLAFLAWGTARRARR